jgi:hypothetical protein
MMITGWGKDRTGWEREQSAGAERKGTQEEKGSFFGFNAWADFWLSDSQLDFVYALDISHSFRILRRPWTMALRQQFLHENTMVRLIGSVTTPRIGYPEVTDSKSASTTEGLLPGCCIILDEPTNICYPTGNFLCDYVLSIWIFHPESHGSDGFRLWSLDDDNNNNNN